MQIHDGEWDLRIVKISLKVNLIKREKEILSGVCFVVCNFLPEAFSSLFRSIYAECLIWFIIDYEWSYNSNGVISLSMCVSAVTTGKYYVFC